MAGSISLKSSNWELNSSIYSEPDEMPLMSSPGPVCMLLAAYWMFIFKIGPDYMSNREPFKLTKTLLVYNSFQVLLSAYLVQNIFKNLLQTGVVPGKCFMNDSSMRKEILFSNWMYLFAKITELADTVIFILRKKSNQVTFLHVYHHSVMMLGTWLTLKYWVSEILLFIGFINSLVHVFMYTYYGLASLGPNVQKYLFWKKYITKLQLAQFVSVMVQYIISLKVSECPPSKVVAVFFSFNIILFFGLFANFYRENYIKKRKAINKDVLKETNPSDNCMYGNKKVL